MRNFLATTVLSVAANPGEVVNFYSITYDANGSTAGITPVMQMAESSRESYYFALDEGRDLRKNGYSFIGWAEDKDATDPKYVAGSTISLSSDKPNKTLYAVWREDKTWANITKMQELTPNTCRGLTLNTSKQLTDDRDSKLYWVTRLADGNCWMTQNLDFEPKNATRYTTPSNPDAWPDNNDEVSRYYDPGDFYKADTSHWASGSCHGAANGFADTGCPTTSAWVTTVTSEDEKHFHIGNYYNWYAATNGSWKDTNIIGANASNSICPSGWQLPRSGVDMSGSFGTSLADNQVTVDTKSLLGVYKIARDNTGATSLRQSPFYFLPGGTVYKGHLDSTGYVAAYWSSTISNSSMAFYFAFYLGFVSPNVGSNFASGATVRCLVLGS